MTEAIPEPTLRRLPAYLRLLREMELRERAWVSCTHLSEALELDPTQVRKDLAFTGVVGRPKVGYQVPILVHAIERFLGWNQIADAFVVGAGNLGSALLGFKGFDRYGMNVVAAFDVDPSRAGGEIHGKPIFPMTRLAELVDRMKVRLVVLAVPDELALTAAKEIKAAGVQAIWNFTSVKLSLDGVMIEDVDMAASLAVLSRRLVAMADGLQQPDRIESQTLSVLAR